MANTRQYGLNSVPIIAQVGGVYLNFGLWAVALVPAWIVVKEIGVTLGDKKVERETLNNVDHGGKLQQEQPGLPQEVARE